MSSFACPECGNPLTATGLCHDCGYRLKKTPSATSRAAAHQPAAIPQTWSREQWAENRILCEPYLVKCKQILNDAEAKHRHDAIPHILSGLALRGVDLSDEAIAERHAIQTEGQ